MYVEEYVYIIKILDEINIYYLNCEDKIVFCCYHIFKYQIL